MLVTRKHWPLVRVIGVVGRFMVSLGKHCRFGLFLLLLEISSCQHRGQFHNLI